MNADLKNGLEFRARFALPSFVRPSVLSGFAFPITRDYGDLIPPAPLPVIPKSKGLSGNIPGDIPARQCPICFVSFVVNRFWYTAIPRGGTPYRH